MLLMLLGMVVTATAIRHRTLPWRWYVTAGLIGAIWPVTLKLSGLAQDVAEAVAGAAIDERLRALGHGFGRLIVNPEEPFALTLVPAILAALLSLRRPGMARVGSLVLLGIAAYPVATFARNTALVHLSGGVPIRLYMQLLPLGLFLVGCEFAAVFARSGPAEETAPSDGA